MIREASVKVDAKAGSLARLVMAAMISALLCLGMLMIPAAGNVKSAFAKDYTYTVTLYAGNGTINGADSITFDGLVYGSTLSLVLDNSKAEGTATLIADGSDYTVAPDDNRYYPKGIRLAGANESSISSPQIAVTQDAQYVVAYGLKQDRVTYRVEYVDANGNALADSQTFYGNVGDKPVAAFQYIDGYVPNALNITGTLDADESNNVFRFVYNPVAGNAYEIIYGSTSGNMATGPAVVLEAAAEAAEAADGTDEAGDTAAGEADEAAPVELIDLDDEETPLASGAFGEAGTAASEGDAEIPVIALGASLAVLAVICAIAAFIVSRKLRKQND